MDVLSIFVFLKLVVPLVWNLHPLVQYTHEPMLGNEDPTSSGRIEHVLKIANEAILQIYETKIKFAPDDLAQTFAELASTSEGGFIFFQF